MARMVEVQFRINKLLFDDRQNVTSSAKNLMEIFSISQDIKTQIKTIVLTNMSTTDNIYYGALASVSTSNSGGILYPKQGREIALVDINFSPYFIGSTNIPLGIELWG